MSKKNHDEGTDRETAVAESLAASEAEAVALEAPAPEVADAAEAPPAGAPTPKRGRDRPARDFPFVLPDAAAAYVLEERAMYLAGFEYSEAA